MDKEIYTHTYIHGILLRPNITCSHSFVEPRPKMKKEQEERKMWRK
jgi:hypothetical protein